MRESIRFSIKINEFIQMRTGDGEERGVGTCMWNGQKHRIKEGQTVEANGKRKRMKVESQKAIMSKQINWFVFILADGYENVPPSYTYCS